MKLTHLTSVAWIAVILIAVACGGKKEEHGHDHEHEGDAKESAEGEWKAMDDFHVVMAETFHPYKDSTNLAPLKNHAEHLAMEADKWSASTLPEKVDNDEVKANLQQLKTDTRSLADKVKAGSSDDELGKELTAVHDLFHEIQEAWYGGHHEHH